MNRVLISDQSRQKMIRDRPKLGDSEGMKATVTRVRTAAMWDRRANSPATFVFHLWKLPLCHRGLDDPWRPFYTKWLDGVYPMPKIYHLWLRPSCSSINIQYANISTYRLEHCHNKLTTWDYLNGMKLGRGYAGVLSSLHKETRALILAHTIILMTLFPEESSPKLWRPSSLGIELATTAHAFHLTIINGYIQSLTFYDGFQISPKSHSYVNIM